MRLQTETAEKLFLFKNFFNVMKEIGDVCTQATFHLEAKETSYPKETRFLAD